MGTLTNSGKLIEKIESIGDGGTLKRYLTEQPQNPEAGDVYYDITNNELMIYDGTQRNTLSSGGGGGTKQGSIDLLVVGGGGGGSYYNSNASDPGAGGAGGYYYRQGMPITGNEYRIIVGKGATSCETKGQTSCFGDCSAGGGGAGAQNGQYNNGARTGLPGTIYGSGGGGGSSSGTPGTGSTNGARCGGGGGAGGNGSTRYGGAGCYNDITGTGHWYAEGGNGANYGNQCGRGQCKCEIYCGKGGNGVSSDYRGTDGIVVVRYRTDGSDGISPTSTGGSIYICGAYTIHCFTSDGYFVPKYT